MLKWLNRLSFGSSSISHLTPQTLLRRAGGLRCFLVAALCSVGGYASADCYVFCSPQVCQENLATTSARGHGNCVLIDIVVSEKDLSNGCYEVVYACATAYSHVAPLLAACGDTYDHVESPVGFDTACLTWPYVGVNTASAWAAVHREGRNNIVACATGQLSTLSNICPEIGLSGGNLFYPRDCDPDPNVTQLGYPIGAAFAHATATYSFTNNCESQPSIEIAGSGTPPLIPGPGDGRSCRVVRVKLVCSGGTQTVCLKYCMFPNGIGSGNVTVNPDGSISINNSLPGCTGLNTLTADEFTFVEEAYDVNGDGRFNSADVTALTALINSTDPDTLANFDFNNNGIIDASDVAVLQGLIDCGLSSGTPGDLNGDGVINCADSCAAATAWGSDADDATYRVELDFDLDGDNDASDKDAFYALNPCLADFNRDGLITIDDLNLFLTAHWLQDPRADMNGSGSVTIDDYFLYMNLYFTLSC